jgi:hypothetical protein
MVMSGVRLLPLLNLISKKYIYDNYTQYDDYCNDISFLTLDNIYHIAYNTYNQHPFLINLLHTGFLYPIPQYLCDRKKVLSL